MAVAKQKSSVDGGDIMSSVYNKCILLKLYSAAGDATPLQDTWATRVHE